MITHFAVTNFKSLAQVPSQPGEFLKFGRLNVLIGPNGSGKSSLLQAIDFLQAFFRTSVEVYLKEREWAYQDLPNLRRTSKRIRWHLKAELDANDEGVGAGSYEYTVALQPKKHLGVAEEHLLWTKPSGSTETLLRRKGRTCRYKDRVSGQEEEANIISLPASVMSRWDGAEDRRRYPEMLRFRSWIEGIRSYLIWDPKVLRNPDRGRHDELGQSGEHLATIIGRMRDGRRRDFDRLVRRLKRLFPTLSDITVSGRGWGWRSICLHEENGKRVTFNSRQLSDGLLRLLAVTALAYAERLPPVVMFEEPENGVHPQLIREVVQLLRELTLRKPPNRCQVFLTTHSPYVLDELYDHPEEVYCVDRSGPQATATVMRLSDNKQIRIARETFAHSLGEAWTSGLIGATAGIKAR